MKTEKEKQSDYYWGPTYDYVPTGLLEFSIENLYSPGFKIRWKDNEKQLLENQSVSIVQGFSRGFEKEKLDRIESEIQQRKWEEERRKREEALRLQKIEDKRRQYLFEVAQDHQKAELVKSLIDALSKIENKEEGIEEWLAWASGVAESLSVLDRKTEIVERHKSFAEEKHYFY